MTGPHGCGRTGLSHGSVVGPRPHAAHPYANALHRGFRYCTERGHAALGDDRDPVTDFEQFVEFLGNHQDCAATIAQIDQVLADERGRADVHPPGWLGADEQFGCLQDLPADDELLQVTAGQ